MDFFKGFFDYLADKTIPFSRKILGMFGIIVAIILINDILGFSFYYNTNQKVRQLKVIYDLYPENIIDTNKIITTLNDLETQIINRKPFISKVIENKLSIKQKNFVKRLLSGSFVFILLSVIYVFIERDKRALGNFYLGMVVILIVVNSILFIIPTFNKIVINHIINIGFSGLLLVILGFIDLKSRKREVK